MPDTRPLRSIARLCCVVLLCATTAAAAQDTAPRYEFRSGFWRNLHHLLYAQALSQPGDGSRRRVRLVSENEAVIDALPAKDRAVWERAREHYATHLAGRSLVFDGDMIALGLVLGAAADADAPGAHEDLPAALRSALLEAAPVYRRHWWSGHDARNREWAADVQQRLQRHGPALRARMAEVFATEWPQEPVPVELAFYANPEGAYTTLDPVAITIASSDRDAQDDAALEILLHETAHAMAGPLRAGLQAALEREACDEAAPLPRDLWHQALFFLVGELVAREVPGHLPYADALDLWQRAWTPAARAALQANLTPYLDGRGDLGTALQGVVQELQGCGRRLAPP